MGSKYAFCFVFAGLAVLRGAGKRAAGLASERARPINGLPEAHRVRVGRPRKAGKKALDRLREKFIEEIEQGGREGVRRQTLFPSPNPNPNPNLPDCMLYLSNMFA